MTRPIDSTWRGPRGWSCRPVLDSSGVATSSTAAARAVLDAVREAFPESALLHGLERIEAGSISDLDIAVIEADPERLQTLRQSLLLRDLLPVIVWPYDTGAVTLLLATAALADGVQLDLLAAPEGEGKYGIRTKVALACAVETEFGRSLAPLDTWLYLLRKRVLKNQWSAVDELLRHRPAGDEVLIVRINELFVGAHARVVRSALDGSRPRPVHAPLKLETARLLRRGRWPAGLFVRVDTFESAHALIGRFEQFVPHTALWPAPSTPALKRLGGALRLSVLRWRAAVVVGWGSRPAIADVVLEPPQSADVDIICETVRQRASQRAATHITKLRLSTSR